MEQTLCSTPPIFLILPPFILKINHIIFLLSSSKIWTWPLQQGGVSIRSPQHSILEQRSGTLQFPSFELTNDQVTTLPIIQIERSWIEFQPDPFIHLDLADAHFPDVEFYFPTLGNDGRIGTRR